MVAVRLAFFRRLNRIFAVTIRWSVDTPSKEEYASQFNALFFHNKFLWDFDIQTDHLISARRSDLMIINKNKIVCKIVDFADPADHRK